MPSAMGHGLPGALQIARRAALAAAPQQRGGAGQRPIRLVGVDARAGRGKGAAFQRGMRKLQVPGTGPSAPRARGGQATSPPGRSRRASVPPGWPAPNRCAGGPEQRSRWGPRSTRRRATPPSSPAASRAAFLDSIPCATPTWDAASPCCHSGRRRPPRCQGWNGSAPPILQPRCATRRDPLRAPPKPGRSKRQTEHPASR